MTDEQIELFFRKPTEAPALGTLGIRYLLRREIQDMFIGKVIPEDKVIEESKKKHHRLFATVMLMMAGIDLLGFL